MITEDITRDVAEAQVSDDCRVQLWVGDLRHNRTAMLTASQARLLAAELIRGAREAERAAAELVRPITQSGFDMDYVHPECIAGKCSNCDGETLTVDDAWVPCDHHCHREAAAA